MGRSTHLLESKMTSHAADVSPLHILQVHTRYRQRGGEDAVVDNERRLLSNAGHEVSLWEASNPESPARALRSLASAPWNRAAAHSMADAVADLRPDVVHVHNTWFAASPSVLAAASKAAPVVQTLHNYRLVCANGELTRDGRPCELCVGSSPWPAVRYGCYRDSRAMSIPAATTIAFNRWKGTWTDHVDKFVALTRFARSRLVVGGIPSDRIDVLPNVVPDPGPRSNETATSDAILFVGRLTEAKGVATLLEAWNKSRPKGLTLRVVGTGPLDAAVASTPGVEAVGWVSPDQVAAEMLSARALVFPSEWYEGMPMTLLEAMAAGLPVVGSNIGSVAEIVGRLGEDWLVAPGDVPAWGEAFEMITDSGRVTAAGSAARSIYESTHTEEAGLQRLEVLYRQVIAERPLGRA